MAKKKNLASLMSGIIGEKSQDELVRVDQNIIPEKENASYSEDVSSDPEMIEPDTADGGVEDELDLKLEAESVGEAPKLTIEMHETLEARRKRNVGRPRRGKEQEKIEEVRATFIIDPELIRKVKYISLADGALLKEVVGAALVDYINRWERKNGKIKLPGRK